MQRQYTTTCPNLNPLGHCSDRSPRHRRIREGPAKGTKMSFGRMHRTEAAFVGELCALEHQLIFARPRARIAAPKRKTHIDRAPRRSRGLAHSPIMIRKDDDLEATRQSPKQLQH